MCKENRETGLMELGLCKKLLGILLLIIPLFTFFSEFSCDIAVDLGFVLDASTSITPKNFNSIKTFMKDLLEEFNIEEGGTHVAAIAFGDRARMAFDFNQLQGRDLTRENLSKRIDGIPQISGSDRLDLALAMANDDMFSFAGGKRDKTPRVILFLIIYFLLP